MHVSTQTLRVALLRIFVDAGVSEGDSLAFPEIAQNWSYTGLRDSDLREAVHELLYSGDLCGVDRAGVLAFELQSKASRNAQSVDDELQYATLQDETTLLEARCRKRAGFDAELRRRADDFPE